MKNSIPKWRSHKVVEAVKIAAVETKMDGSAVIAPEDRSVDTVYAGAGWRDNFKGEEDGDLGYYVRYEGGYESWSPSEPFEKGYTKLEDMDHDGDGSGYGIGIVEYPKKAGKKMSRINMAKEKQELIAKSNPHKVGFPKDAHWPARPAETKDQKQFEKEYLQQPVVDLSFDKVMETAQEIFEKRDRTGDAYAFYTAFEWANKQLKSQNGFRHRVCLMSFGKNGGGCAGFYNGLMADGSIRREEKLKDAHRFSSLRDAETCLTYVQNKGTDYHWVLVEAKTFPEVMDRIDYGDSDGG